VNIRYKTGGAKPRPFVDRVSITIVSLITIDRGFFGDMCIYSFFFVDISTHEFGRHHCTYTSIMSSSAAHGFEYERVNLYADYLSDMAYAWTDNKPGVQQHEEDFYCLKLIFISSRHAYLLMLRCLDKLVQTYELSEL